MEHNREDRMGTPRESKNTNSFGRQTGRTHLKYNMASEIKWEKIWKFPENHLE